MKSLVHFLPLPPLTVCVYRVPPARGTTSSPNERLSLFENVHEKRRKASSVPNVIGLYEKGF